MWAAGLAFPQESGDPHSKKLSEFNRLGSWMMFPASDASGLLWRRQVPSLGGKGVEITEWGPWLTYLLPAKYLARDLKCP